MKKLIASILAAGMTLALISCGETAPETDDTPEKTTESMSESVTETERLKPDIPESDFSEYQFTVLARGSNAGDWANYDIESDGINGDIVNDNIYERNAKVEELLNIKIKHEKVNGYDVVTPAKQSILAASDDYDIIMPSITDAGNLAQNDLLTPLGNLRYLDTDKPWYDHNCLSELEINGQNYMFFSDITVCNLDAIWIYLFNKQVIDDYKLEDPYELVMSGKWTLDKMTSMCKEVTHDLNGDGKQDSDDRWGIVGHDYIITASYIGSGERIATADRNGKISLTMNSSRIHDVIDSLISLEDYWIRYSLTAKKYSTAAPFGFKSGEQMYDKMLDMFTNGQALFMGEVMDVMAKMRDRDVEFGVLPSPKLDEKQDGYHSAVNYIAAVTCVPKTASDLDRTSIIVEALAAESHYTVVPAYYEIAMKSKYARDTVSSDMLDLILGSRSYDLGIYYNWGGLSDRFCSLVYEGSTDFASMYDSNKSAAEDAIEKFTSGTK